MILSCLEEFVSCLTKETFCFCIIVLHEICHFLEIYSLLKVLALLTQWYLDTFSLGTGVQHFIESVLFKSSSGVQTTCRFIIWLKLWGAVGRVSHELMLWRNTRWTPDLLKLCEFCYMFSFRMACTRCSFIATSIPLALILQTCIQYYCKEHQLIASIKEIIAAPVGAETTLRLLHAMLNSVSIFEKLLMQKNHPVYHKTLTTPINTFGTSGDSLDVYFSKGLGFGGERQHSLFFHTMSWYGQYWWGEVENCHFISLFSLVSHQLKYLEYCKVSVMSDSILSVKQTRKVSLVNLRTRILCCLHDHLKMSSNYPVVSFSHAVKESYVLKSLLWAP